MWPNPLLKMRLGKCSASVGHSQPKPQRCTQLTHRDMCYTTSTLCTAHAPHNPSTHAQHFTRSALQLWQHEYTTNTTNLPLSPATGTAEPELLQPAGGHQSPQTSSTRAGIQQCNITQAVQLKKSHTSHAHTPGGGTWDSHTAAPPMQIQS